MMGSSVLDIFARWGIDNKVSDFVNHFGLQNKDCSLLENKNISESQKELMPWHLKLGVSMSHVQRLMKVSEKHELNERISVMDKVLVPKLTAAENYEIPLRQSCNLS